VRAGAQLKAWRRPRSSHLALPVCAALIVAGQLIVPGSAHAADVPEVVVERNPAVVFLFVGLLAGALAAGLLFASSWRGRISASAAASQLPPLGLLPGAGQERRPRIVGGDILGRDDPPDLAEHVARLPSSAGPVPTLAHASSPPSRPPESVESRSQRWLIICAVVVVALVAIYLARHVVPTARRERHVLFL
jgi:hypothetical protein